jgi:hypothetical protein
VKTPARPTKTPARVVEATIVAWARDQGMFLTPRIPARVKLTWAKRVDAAVPVGAPLGVFGWWYSLDLPSSDVAAGGPKTDNLGVGAE